ncbi:MAG: hypothetical protein K8W52_29825 [Deltaproteobacteria bacterium]|nr:hypothetical protein [Deltaproteobacteria bacterium]
MALRPDQIRRYARHVLLPDIGGVGQARLLGARVRVALGDPAAEVAAVYLAAAGIGGLALSDGDRPLDDAAIETGIACIAADRGRAHAAVVADRIRALTPDCAIVDLAEHALALADEPALPPLPGSAVADALVRGGAAACALLHALATTA